VSSRGILRYVCLALAAGGIMLAGGCYRQVVQIGDLPVVVQPIAEKPRVQPDPAREIRSNKRMHPVALVGKVEFEARDSEWIVKAKVKNIYIKPVRRVYIRAVFLDSSGKRLKLKQSVGINRRNETEDEALCVIEGNTLQPDEVRSKSWAVSRLSGMPAQIKASIVAVLFEDGSKWIADTAPKNFFD
jgi:hypothetical protein